MTTAQIEARVQKAAAHRRAAIRELGRALAALSPAADAARADSDAAPIDTYLNMERAERKGALADRLEAMLGDLGIVFEELQNVEVPQIRQSCWDGSAR